MRIGISLPNTLPPPASGLTVSWARHAEARGFAFVSTIGRVAWPSDDGLTALAAAGGATSRIGLQSNAVLGPTYPSAMLAKVALSIARICGERLSLTLGIGDRRSDYEAADRSFDERGEAFDRQLEFLVRAFRAEAVVADDREGEQRRLTAVPVEIPLLIGGHGRPAIRRTIRWGAGWASGAQDVATVARLVRKITDAWSEAGRSGTPRLVGMACFCTSSADVPAAQTYLLDYYASYGDRAKQIARRLLRTPQQIKDALRQFADLGINEFVFSPTVPDTGEVHRLADLVL